MSFPEYNNSNRSEAAFNLIVGYSERTAGRNRPLVKDGVDDYDSDELGVDIGDVLGDLMHLCDRRGLSFQDLLERGEAHYIEEVNDQ